VAPSATVSADFRLQTITLKDGRVLSGVVASENDSARTIRLLNEEVTVPRDEIISQKLEAVSIMPAGLLSVLSFEQKRDLIAYLMHPQQVK
jgi:putative heme-binding domain-containing protein